jgi:N-acetylmuramoyl-L-alanine amidase
LQVKVETSLQNFKNPPDSPKESGWLGVRFVISLIFLAFFWSCLWLLMHAFTPENPGFQVLPALNEGQVPPDLANAPPELKTIVIDPGHGGEDPGTQGNGMFEREGTLPIAQALAKELRERKYTVVMTRETDTTLSLDDRSKKGNEPATLCFVSIHLNHSDSARTTGIETYYAWPKRLEILKDLAITHPAPTGSKVEDQRGRLLAESIQRATLATTQATDREVRNNPGLRVLNSVRAPSVLVECGFVSNKAETEKLRSADYQATLAKGIANGIESYLQAASADPNYGIVVTTKR